MNERAPTRSTVPSSIAANVRSLVKSVPDVCGVRFFSARKPAMAIGSTSAGNRPSKRTTPVAMFQAGLLSDNPSKPEPLLAAAEVNS